ncbi:hypothetical protein [Stackebrandtia nassauensis]|uniref:Uncharacterized protein n=1 Tax=Stackebrandtia nassauensis (strain DSM 44728 / CIP 108903 / NRRL B-16338 / NBRC 102104 / LLR-40K-21) TaxID=446470 RepID=D3PY07_STANL|nr:hypothetical protein [Stackebrandtia nassauensis]ADD45336.1 hypothetical protein Snas_5706 [Stackebrandtia nassauensis DSM 44728]
MRDPRVVAVCSAGILAALLGIGQLLAADLTGILFSRGGVRATAQDTVDESAIVIWIAAVAVCLAAAAPRIFLKSVPGHRMRWVLSGAAAFGALLAAPVATAIASWAQVYGSELSQSRVLRLVCLGVVLGAVVSAAAVRSKPAAWSLISWVGVVWVLLLVSVRTSPGATPLISHLDPGPQWSSGNRFLQGSLLLLMVAVLCGAALGVAGIKLRWGRDMRRCRSAIALMSVAGPLVVLVAYLTAGVAGGDWNGGHVLNLTAASVLIATGYWAGACLTKRLRRDGPAGTMSA